MSPPAAGPVMTAICCVEVVQATDWANCSRGTSSGTIDLAAGPDRARVVPESTNAA